MDDGPVRISFHRSFTALAVALTVVACGCSPDGARSGRPATAASSAAEATPVATSAATDPARASRSAVPPLAPFRITSPAFADGAAIPSKFSCDGAGISPEVAWAGAPAGTKALALTVIDPDANGFVHWLAYDIPGASDGSLPEKVGTGSSAPPQGKNGRGARGYTGPCPPSGTHHYVFTLYALDGLLGLTGTPTRSEVEAAIKDHALGMAVLTGTYKRS